MTHLSRIDLLFAKEIVSLCLVIMASVSSVMFVFRIYAYADFIILSQDGLATLILFVVFLFPAIFKLTIPISLLLASLIVTIRMSQDRELEAMMANGASLWRLARAPTVVGFVAMVLSLYTGLYLEPYSREQMSQFRWMQTVRGLENFISSRLDDRAFLNDIFPLDDVDVSLYVENIPNEKGDLEGVFLSLKAADNADESDMVLLGETGSLRKEFDGTFPDYVFTVNDGYVYQPGRLPLVQVDPPASPANSGVEESGGGTESQMVSRALTYSGGEYGPLPQSVAEVAAGMAAWDVFQFTQLKLSIFSLFRRHKGESQDGEVGIRTLQPAAYLEELKRRRTSESWGSNQRYIRDHTYFYEAATVPLACLFLPMMGICLGLLDPRRKAGFAYLGLGIVMFIYYSAVKVCQQLALELVVSPELTLWLPSLVILALAMVLFRWRLVYPPSTRFVESVTLDFRALKAALLSRRGEQ